MTTHIKTLEVDVQIDVTDPEVFGRITGPSGDEWRAGLYHDIKTQDDVLEHLAYNAVVNGIGEVNRLDGWADLQDGAATLKLFEVRSA